VQYGAQKACVAKLKLTVILCAILARGAFASEITQLSKNLKAGTHDPAALVRN
jgi:hypothetical protein